MSGQPTSHPGQSQAPLVVAITARALFHLEDGHHVFEQQGIAAYAEYQRLHENDVLPQGIAFPLVRKLLALNAGAAPDSPRVEVILLSRNSSDTGLRIFNSIEHYGLKITRAVFTSGAEVYPYIQPFGAQLFLSANPDSVRSALEHGIAAATILPAVAAEQVHPELRIAFDGDDFVGAVPRFAESDVMYGVAVITPAEVDEPAGCGFAGPGAASHEGLDAGDGVVGVGDGGVAVADGAACGDDHGLAEHPAPGSAGETPLSGERGVAVGFFLVSDPVARLVEDAFGGDHQPRPVVS